MLRDFKVLKILLLGGYAGNTQPPENPLRLVTLLFHSDLRLSWREDSPTFPATQRRRMNAFPKKYTGHIPLVWHQPPCLSGSKSHLSLHWSKFPENEQTEDAESEYREPSLPKVSESWNYWVSYLTLAFTSKPSWENGVLRAITLMSPSPNSPWYNVTDASFLIISSRWICGFLSLQLTALGSSSSWFEKVTLFLPEKLNEALGAGDSKSKWSSMGIKWLEVFLVMILEGLGRTWTVCKYEIG